MLNGLEILNLLNDKNALGLKPLSEYVFKQLNSNSKMYDYSSQLNQTDDGEFEIADDDDDDNDDDNGTAADLNSNDGFSSNDDYDEDAEQDNTRNLINTTKEEFSGM
ncbi:unnamed protein product, partial [Rotaria socialis]